MKIKVDLELDISAKAVYRSGKVELSVVGSMPYAKDRQASATISSGFSDEVQDVFEKAFALLIEEQKDKIVQVARAANSEALSVAVRMGEL